jgi:26S proteasome regulatory subunit T5
MSSAPEPPSDPPAGNNSQKPDVPPQPATSPPADQDGVSMDTTPDQPPEETWDDIPEEIKALTTEEILTRIRLIDNDIKVRRFRFRKNKVLTLKYL